MAPNVTSARLTLSCPLFAADFDPRNDTFLVVGGGGGEGRSGVGNKLASSWENLTPRIPKLTAICRRFWRRRRADNYLALHISIYLATRTRLRL